MAFSATDKKNIKNSGDDDWETDSSYVNDISEKDQRWGSKEIGGKAKEVVNMNELRTKVKETDDKAARDELTKKPGSAYGYGGKFGVQTDRMDKSAHTNAVEEDKDTGKNTSYKPQGPLKDTKSAAKVFEQKAAANKSEPVKVAPTKAVTPPAKYTPPAPKPVQAPTPAAKFTPPAPVAAKPTPKFVPKAPEPVRMPEPEPEPVYVPEPEPEPVYVPEPVRMPEPEPEQSNDWSEPSAVSEAPVAAVEEWAEEPVQNAEIEQVVVIEETYQAEQPQAGNGDLPAQARALYDFDAQDAEELGFKAGDTINIIQAVDAEWWQGEVDGRQGIFPVSYVEAL